MEEFMQAMSEVFPRLLVQFEDFSTDNAFKYLDVFRSRYRCFNDDVNNLSHPPILSRKLNSIHRSREQVRDLSVLAMFDGPLLITRTRSRCSSALRLHQCGALGVRSIWSSFVRPQDLVFRSRVCRHWGGKTVVVLFHAHGCERGGCEETNLCEFSPVWSIEKC